jgi:hypothetical protein
MTSDRSRRREPGFGPITDPAKVGPDHFGLLPDRKVRSRREVILGNAELEPHGPASPWWRIDEDISSQIFDVVEHPQSHRSSSEAIRHHIHRLMSVSVRDATAGSPQCLPLKWQSGGTDFAATPFRFATSVRLGI